MSRTDNPLVQHAFRELTAIGQFEDDPEFAASILRAVQGFASYPGHSGSSAMIGAQMVFTLLRFENLGPLTDDPEEWVYHGEEIWGKPGGVWQNKRNGEAFSEDGGKTYRLNSERPRGWLKRFKRHPLHTTDWVA